jgi:hypothetical protein
MPMTKEEFYYEMLQLKEQYGDYEELFHSLADDLMCNLLVELGYEAGVDVFLETPKWYS